MLFVAMLATLTVLGALVTGLTVKLRADLHAQVLRREAEALHAVASMQLNAARVRPEEIASGDATQILFTAVLESSRLRGVLAVQLFDATGALRDALPVSGDAGPRWWSPTAVEPVARFLGDGALESVYGLEIEPGAPATRVPLLEVVVPLRGGGKPGAALGTAHYWIDGAPLAAEFSRMDRALAWQAGAAYGAAAVVVVLVLAWAFARLEQANRRLREQSVDLARANQELDFAAKMGAIGAISAHLIHGLKNPLAGLEGFATDNALEAGDSTRGEAWRAAMETTRRLRGLVTEVVAVLQEEADDQRADYRMPVKEIVETARNRAAAAAAKVGVELAVTAPAGAALPARTANLAGLVLVNLVANAIEASSRGGRVSLEARTAEGGVEFLVRDTGSGLPVEVRGAMFQPVRSDKPGGGGVGLTISHRLARHAQGRLELVSSDAQGTVFRLWVPGRVLPGAISEAAVAEEHVQT